MAERTTPTSDRAATSRPSATHDGGLRVRAGFAIRGARPGRAMGWALAASVGIHAVAIVVFAVLLRLRSADIAPPDVTLEFAVAVDGEESEAVEDLVFEPVGELPELEEIPSDAREAPETPEVPEELDQPDEPDLMEPPTDEEPIAGLPLETAPGVDLIRLRTRPRRTEPSASPPTPAQAAVRPPRPPPTAPHRATTAGVARAALRPLAWPRVTAANYPPLALRQGTQGTVVVEITVAMDGSVVGARVVESSGSIVLDDDALVRARQFRFAPIDRTRRANVPIRYRIL